MNALRRQGDLVGDRRGMVGQQQFGAIHPTQPEQAFDEIGLPPEQPVDGVLNLWVAPIDRIDEARPVTAVTDRNLGPWIVWMRDNRHVVFFLQHQIAEHGKRADGIVKSMLEHSRGVSGERRVVDLNALIEEALNLAYHGARAQDASFNITLERGFDRGLASTELAPQEITRVFLNLLRQWLLRNYQAAERGVGLDFRPTLKVTTRELGDAVEVRVRD